MINSGEFKQKEKFGSWKKEIPSLPVICSSYLAFSGYFERSFLSRKDINSSQEQSQAEFSFRLDIVFREGSPESSRE